MTRQIAYREGYKYQLYETAELATPVPFLDTPEYLESEFFTFTRGAFDAVSESYCFSKWVARVGYAWDGPSGPTVDTLNFMRGSLWHDIFYQAMREGLLPATKENRRIADENLRAICLEDGMSSLRAWWVYQGVRVGGGSSAAVGRRRIIYAPAED